MKRFSSIIALSFVLTVLIPAQNFSNEFGKVGSEEVNYSAYTQDKTAEAVVLFDIGQSYFNRTENGFDVMFERTTRIKVFKEAGIKWANVEIPYYQEGDIFEEIEEIEGWTYNLEDGVLSKIKLNVATCHDEKLNKYWIQKKFALPNVKEGSIIEYHYKIRSQYHFNLRDWEFQWKIPVIYSKYEVKMIPFYQYTWLLQGASKFDSTKSYVSNGMEQQFGPINFKEMVHEYVMKDVPAFKDEEFISNEADYIIKLDFQLSKVIQLNGTEQKILTTWPEMNKDLIKNEDFGGYMRKSEKIASKIFDMERLSQYTSQVKFDSIMNYVKGNYSWNKTNGKLANKSLKTFMTDKNGNAAEVNLFALGLLKAAGVKATPVIVSTRENGKIKYDYPFNHFFNFVIILADIDGKMVLADATENLSLNNRIPVKCINDKGLIVQKDSIHWVSLQTLVPSNKRTKISINLSDSSQNAEIETSSTEYDALGFRKDYGANTGSIQKYLIKKGYSIVDSSIVVKNQMNMKEPYILKYKVEDKPEIINEKIYISPFLHETMMENPLKQITRTYPIDMIYPIKRSCYAQINIPEGYKVDFLPVNTRIRNEQFEMDYIISSDEQKINVALVYYFKQSVYQPDEYTKMKYYFTEIVNKGYEKIVFAKK